jgi:hypothetical protein
MARMSLKTASHEALWEEHSRDPVALGSSINKP